MLTALVMLAWLAPSPAAPVPRTDRLARILALEDARSIGGGELEAILRTGDRGLRRRAALAAGRIGDPRIVPALVETLKDGEPEVRQMAAFALGLLGDPRAIDPLLLALQDPERVVRSRATEALGRIGDKRVVPAIVDRVGQALPEGSARLSVRGDDPGNPADPWAELRLSLLALWRLGDLPAIRSVLLADGAARFDWWLPTWIAMRLEDPSLVPVLRASASSSDPYTRALAARGLGALKEARHLDVLEALLRDRDEIVVAAAVRALGSIDDRRATGLVVPRLQSERPIVLWEALQALTHLPPDPALRELIVGHAGHPAPFVRAAALAALAHTVPSELPLVLSGMDPDPVPSVRAALAAALGETGGMAAGLLLGLVRDEDPHVVAAVLGALAQVRGADAVPTLQRHLEHPHPAVKAAALAGLAELKAPGLVPLASEAWQARGAEDDVRLAAVDALASRADDPAAVAVLTRAASEDPWRVVRVRARDALARTGQAGVPDPGPQELWRPVADYREAMAPYAPQHGVELFTPRVFLHTNRGVVEIHLDVVEAPLTTAAFLDLARRGYYDGTTFHRVVPAFVAQGGDPTGTGSGGPGWTLRTEAGQRSFGRGVVGMASAGLDTEGSQFFVMLQPSPHLDGRYTAFGHVATGMEVVDALVPGDRIERIDVWSGRD